MTQKVKRQEMNISRMLLLSVAVHLLTLFIINSSSIFHDRLHEVTPYYVDIVSLPSISPAPPASGSETAADATPAPPPPPAAPQPPPAPASMAMPTKITPLPQPQPPSPSAEQLQREQREQDAKNFLERMNRIERNADARHQAEAIAALQRKAAQQKKGGGLPAATGESGSDYGAYIQSRLKDALADNLVYRSQRPEVAVHIYIDKNGKLIRYVMTQPSADKLFNSSVIRTIEKAKTTFPPVPNGQPFDKLFVFSPQEVKN